jgi:hypothetical protein
MADRFDVVAVWIEDISAVVGRVVLRSKPRLPVIARASRDSSLMEGVHGSTVFAGERDVDRSAHFTLPDPEIRLSRPSEAQTWDMMFHDQPVAQRGQSFLVEALAPLKVSYGKTNVIQHRRSPPMTYETEPTSVTEWVSSIMLSSATANVGVFPPLGGLLRRI